MTQSKHSPGPWRALKAYDAYISGHLHNIIEICGELPKGAADPQFDREGVSVVITPHVDGYKKELPTRKANANLIAAAPDMLEALEVIQSNIAPDGKKLEIIGGNGEPLNIGNLIAKAKGEE